MTAPAIGTTIGSYRLLKKLGQGAMGQVYLALHPSGRKCALKVIHPELATNVDMVSRFFTEARAVNQISQPHIIEVIDFGQTPHGENYIAMEVLEGITLGERIKLEEYIDVTSTLHIALQICEGLVVAHSRGVIHRDLKPDNIFLIDRNGDSEYVKILDFGLAKMTAGGQGALQHKTQSGSVLGTPHYMAPEQCEGKEVDHRVDVYALGCIMFQMLCGRVPFPGDGFGEVLIKHLREPPTAPSKLNPEIPPSVEKIILHALAKKPDFRFQSMNEFSVALSDPDRFMRALEGNAQSTATFEVLDIMNAPMQPPARNHVTPVPERVLSPKTDHAAPTLKGSLSALEEGVARAAEKAQREMQASVETPDETGTIPDMASPVPVAPARGGASGPTQRPLKTEPMRFPSVNDTLPPGEAPSSVLRGQRRSGGPTLIVTVGMVVLGAGGIAAAIFLRPGASAPDDAAILVSSQPIGADVTREGRPLGKTPMVVHVPTTGVVAPIVLHKDGYADVVRELDAKLARVDIPLVPVAATPQPTTTPPAVAPSPSPSPARSSSVVAAPATAPGVPAPLRPSPKPHRPPGTTGASPTHDSRLPTLPEADMMEPSRFKPR